MAKNALTHHARRAKENDLHLYLHRTTSMLSFPWALIVAFLRSHRAPPSTRPLHSAPPRSASCRPRATPITPALFRPASRGQSRHYSRGVAGEQGRQPAAFSKVAHTLRRLSRVLYQKHPTKRHSSPLRCDCGRMILSLRAIELNSSDEIGSLVASRKSAAFLPSNPVQKDGTSRAQHRAEPEQRQSAAFRKVINRGAPLW